MRERYWINKRDVCSISEKSRKNLKQPTEWSNMRKNHHDDPHSQSDGMFSSHHNDEYYQQPPRKGPLIKPFPKDSKVDLSSL